jgi:ABC-type glycerol-3-phosphate transport system permease component
MSESKPAVATIFDRNVVAYATLSLISIFCAIPFVWLILASFDGNASLFLRWPNPWTLNNYIGIFVREGRCSMVFQLVSRCRDCYDHCFGIRLVLAPLAVPGLGAAGLFAFISAWGDFLMPLILLSASELQMLPLGMFRAFSARPAD